MNQSNTLNQRIRRLIVNWLPLILLIILLMVVWEATKAIGGSPWRTEVGDVYWDPPVRWRFANDLNMPHLWEIFQAFVRPASRNGPPLTSILIDAMFWSFRVTLVGFAFGTLLGLVIAMILIHSDMLYGAFMPYIVASQTVPILVIAPMVVIWLQAGWWSVAVIASYLTFFPVTIAALRGFRSVSPESLDLMYSYGATPLDILIKVRFPTALPYLFVGFKIAATASVIGTIVGELPSGIDDGLGSVILNYAQYYTTAPSRLWATLLASAVLGIAVYLLVILAERIVLRFGFQTPEDKT